MKPFKDLRKPGVNGNFVLCKHIQCLGLFGLLQDFSSMRKHFLLTHDQIQNFSSFKGSPDDYRTTAVADKSMAQMVQLST